MSEWIDFIHWQECKVMERQGYIFEVVNADDQYLLTTCTTPLDFPFDWTSSPVKFRMIAETKPRHSDPLPPPIRK